MIVYNDVPQKPCAWARWLLRSGDFRVIDTETTGLDDDSKIVSIGIVDQDGRVLVNSLVNPGASIPRDATDIHGVTDEMVKDAPTFEQLYPEIRRALLNQRWVIYNAAYDIPRLRYECERYGLLFPSPARMFWRYGGWDGITTVHEDTHCAMEMYAVHHGAWSEYHGSYKWQRLSTAAKEMKVRATNAHNALADAQTTLAVIKAMALDEDWEAEEQDHG